MHQYVVAALIGAAFLPALEALINHTPVADVVVTALLTEDTEGEADAIVVLGGGVTEECTLNVHSERRLLLAARLYREGRAPLILLTGGHPTSSSCSVAGAMREMARELSIRAEHILLEDQARSTWENASLSAPILRAAGVDRVLLVTDRLHMRRAELCFTRLSFRVERAMVPLYRAHDDNVEMLGAAMREILATLYYRMRGWL